MIANRLKKAMNEKKFIAIYTHTGDDLMGFVLAVDDEEEFMEFAYIDNINNEPTQSIESELEEIENEINDIMDMMNNAAFGGNTYDAPDRLFAVTTMAINEIYRIDYDVPHILAQDTAQFVKHFTDNSLDRLIDENTPAKQKRKKQRQKNGNQTKKSAATS